jgi:hypothetical protein
MPSSNGPNLVTELGTVVYCIRLIITVTSGGEEAERVLGRHIVRLLDLYSSENGWRVA